MTFEETIKIADYKEQLASILSNIRDANQELEKVFDKKKEIQDEVNELEVYQSKVKIAINKASNQLQELGFATNKLNSIINSQQLTIEKQKNETKKETEHYNTFIKKSVSTNRQLTDDISDLQLYKDSLTFSIKEIEKKEIESKNRLSIISKEVGDVAIELSKLVLEKEKKEQETKDFILESEKQMKEVKKSIEDEKDKIRRPMELLNEANEEIEKNKRNVLILENRLRRVFKKMYPNLEPPL